MRKLVVAGTVVLALLAAPLAAHAQFRTIPTDAKRGTLRHLQENIVEINGSPMRLAAAAQIRNESNMIVVPASLPPRSLVRFTVDATGHVTRIWILSPTEAAQPDPR